jgi:hypothetical protein
MCIRKPRTIGATSIRSARAPVTTKASAAPETLFFDYPPPAQHADQGNAHLQYLRPAHAPKRRPRVVSNFVIQALLGQDITVYGDGSQTRSFCYVDDLIDGMVRLMATPDAVTGPIIYRQSHGVYDPTIGLPSH